MNDKLCIPSLPCPQAAVLNFSLDAPQLEVPPHQLSVSPELERSEDTLQAGGTDTLQKIQILIIL